jgi:hypothetical protein
MMSKITRVVLLASSFVLLLVGTTTAVAQRTPSEATKASDEVTQKPREAAQQTQGDATRTPAEVKQQQGDATETPAEVTQQQGEATQTPAEVKQQQGEVTRQTVTPVATQRIPPATGATRRGAAMLGRVEDESGREIPGLNVSLRNTESGKATQGQTTGDGIFRLVDLAGGAYDLSIQGEGFTPFSRSGIKIGAGEVLTVEITIHTAPGAIPRPGAMGRTMAGSVPANTEDTNESSYRELRRRPADEQQAEPEEIASDEKLFIPRPDRWDVPMPEYERYANLGDVPNVQGHWYDPYNRNVLKGDYPIFGKQTFFNFTGSSVTAFDVRRFYIPSNVGSARANSSPFFGRGGQGFLFETARFSFDLFHGDTSFKPVDWRIRITPAVNINYINGQENGIVRINVAKGTNRTDAHLGLQEAFVEYKIADVSPHYDFVSVRAGIQQFSSDFRGFLFVDEQPGVRIFGNLRSDKWEYNLAYFHMLEKDTNSGLNTFDRRHQQVMIANFYWQDFIKKGYTTQISYHFNKDDADIHFNENGFLVRPAPVGNVVAGGEVKAHNIRAHYIGWTGNGHINRINVSHAFYQVLGHDDFNAIAGHYVTLNAQMGALELSLDKDWIRYRTSFFYGSGDRNPRDNSATGFDAIRDTPTFAGGVFSFWNREGIRLTGTGVGLMNPESLLPSLRSDKDEGQANFVNPGIFIYNLGADFDLTPKIRAVVTGSYLRFARTAVIEQLEFQAPIRSTIGQDYGLGVIYRPPLSENIVFTGGVSALVPGQGLRDIYTSKTLFSTFGTVKFQF